jgi:4-hydroxy-4-methyl-2-oxoglutarate aldolase
MIEEPKTLRIARDMRRPTPAQIKAFQGAPTGFVVDAMMGPGAMDKAIKPISGQSATIAGPALTAWNRPSDLLATLAALKFVKPGDVMIATAQGFQGCAAVGDRVSGFFKNSGAAALVTDGPMRDFDGVLNVGLPCWCTGLNPNSPYATGPGQVGVPVQIGGVSVATGDMIVADTDGVVVVPFAQIDDVIAKLGLVAEAETAMDKEVTDGLKCPPSILEMLDGEDIEYL